MTTENDQEILKAKMDIFATLRKRMICSVEVWVSAIENNNPLLAMRAIDELQESTAHNSSRNTAMLATLFHFREVLGDEAVIRLINDDESWESRNQMFRDAMAAEGFYFE